MYPKTCTDARLGEALLRVVDHKQRFVGTAFAVGSDGTCITCDHVMQASPSLKFIDRRGRVFAIERLDTPALAGTDLALVRLIANGHSLPPPLPLHRQENPSGFRMRTWLGADPGIVDSLPVIGTVTGSTRIAYTRAGRNYAPQDVITLTGASITPGMSGSPLLDDTSDA